MKKLLLACLLCIYGLVNAQPYESFFNKDKIEYHLCMQTLMYEYSTFTFYICQEDTAYYHNVCYYKCRFCLGGVHAYLREDTSCGKIYRYYPNIDSEYVWCDMSLNVGDTFCLPTINEDEHWYEGQNTKLVVDSIVYVKGRKIIYFPWSASSFLDIDTKLRFIEGIGPTYGPMGFEPIELNSLCFLSCVHFNDSLVFMANAEAGCDIHYENIEEKNIPQYIRLHPNPVNNMLYIQSLDEQEIGDITICDISGRTIYHTYVNTSSTTIDISQLDNGVYVIMLNDNNRKDIYKFVKIN